MSTAKAGRASLYRNKKGGVRVQGVLTREGGRLFDTLRKRIARRFRREVVSDADVIEALVRGDVQQ